MVGSCCSILSLRSFIDDLIASASVIFDMLCCCYIVVVSVVSVVVITVVIVEDVIITDVIITDVVTLLLLVLNQVYLRRCDVCFVLNRVCHPPNYFVGTVYFVGNCLYCLLSCCVVLV